MVLRRVPATVETPLPSNHANRASHTADRKHVCVLSVLYLLQGIPHGLAQGALPILLQARLCSLTSIGMLSFAAYPYALKLMWSPIVDVVYSSRLGRRKSWVLPCTFAASALMYLLSLSISDSIASCSTQHLSGLLFLVILAMATQDIALDAWAVSLLSPKHIAWASGAQTIGMGIGNFLGFPFVLILTSADACVVLSCDKDAGMVTLSSVMRVWSLMFAIVALFVALCVPEVGHWHNTSEEKATRQDCDTQDQRDVQRIADDAANKPLRVRLKRAYEHMLRMCSLRSVQCLAVLLGLCRIGFLPVDTVARLQFLDKGLRPQHLALLVLVQLPVDVAISVLCTAYISRLKPTNNVDRNRLSGGGTVLGGWLLGYCLSLLVALLAPLLCLAFPNIPHEPQADVPWRLLGCVSVVMGLASMANKCMFIAIGAFFNSITDTTMGATYVAVLYALTTLGWSWPRFAVYHATDVWGYYWTSFVAFIVGLGLLPFFRTTVIHLESLPLSAWRTPSLD